MGGGCQYCEVWTLRRCNAQGDPKTRALVSKALLREYQALAAAGDAVDPDPAQLLVRCVPILSPPAALLQAHSRSPAQAHLYKTMRAVCAQLRCLSHASHIALPRRP